MNVRETVINYRTISKTPAPQMTGPQTVASLVRTLLPDNSREHFIVLHLNSSNRIVSYRIVSSGLQNQCQVHPREVFQAALIEGAVNIIIAHNHPSGETNPSDADEKITKQLTEGAKILGLKILDHVIVAEDSHYSFEESGLNARLKLM